MIELAPSLLSANFSCLRDEIKKVESAGIKYLHFDVMDGHFVPNITIGPIVISSLRSTSSSIFDVHLMINNPENYIQIFKDAGADIITVHYETCIHLNRIVNMIKSLGIRAGVAINPSTPPEALEYIMSDVDMILVMSVNPGFGGQKFIPSAVDKIQKVKSVIDKKKLNIKIEVDGGIDINTINKVVSAGAEIIVAGASVYKTPDPVKAIEELYAKVR